MPKVSVITINYNNYEGLKKTMESVFSQTVISYEYIIIDGGSGDGSKEWIEQFADKLSYWVSEKDNGIFHAMNKGIVKANGEYLIFLNSGDCFYSSESLLHLINKSNGEDIIYGNMLVEEKNGRQWPLSYPSELTFGHFYTSSLPHQASLIRKTLFDKIGLYDENFRIAADWEFFLKAIAVCNCTYKHVNEIITIFSMDGISTNPLFTNLALNERNNVLAGQYSLYLQEHAEYLRMKRELNNYKNSRAHKFIDRIIKSSLLRRIK